MSTRELIAAVLAVLVAAWATWQRRKLTGERKLMAAAAVVVLAVYAQFDLLGGGRSALDPGILRELTEDMALAPVLGNDLQPGVLALRPELESVLESLQQTGALGALVSGSGPTCFALFDDLAAAVTAAATLDGAIAAALRSAETIESVAEGAAPTGP